MTQDDKSSDLLVQHSRQLWVLTIVFFLFGDLVTTGVGVATGGIVEAGPLGAPIVSSYGMPGMIILKFVVLGLTYVAWKFVPSPERNGIPLGLAIVGFFVTAWNSLILLAT